MKIFSVVIAALALAACGADQATINRDTLGTSQTLIVGAQKVALDYRARPVCTATVTVPCRNPAVYAEMQRLDRMAVDANNAAYVAVQANPEATSTKLAVDAAIAVIKNFDAYAKEQK